MTIGLTILVTWGKNPHKYLDPDLGPHLPLKGMEELLLKTPLLIWVDDHAERGPTAEVIAYAKKRDINVHNFKTTAEAETWIDHYLDFLRNHNDKDGKSVRLVTDLIRWEDNGKGPELDIDAGFKIAKFFRDRLSQIPILVFTHEYNIERSKFVSTMEPAGSTFETRVVEEYIDDFAGVLEREAKWGRYNAQ